MRAASDDSEEVCEALAMKAEPREGEAGFGVEIEVANERFVQPLPVRIMMASDPESAYSSGYGSFEPTRTGFSGIAAVEVPGATVNVVDEWTAEPGEIVVARTVGVAGRSDDGFSSSLALRRVGEWSWPDVEPFAPGVVYGNCEFVPENSIGSAALRRSGVTHVLVREDRLAAPFFAVRYPDDLWIAVMHADPTGGTTALDCAEPEGGDSITDSRFEFAALGGSAGECGLELGLWFPGTEGETTYTSSGLPLRQVRQWRRRYHPVVDGFRQDYRVAFRFGVSTTATSFFRRSWRAAWADLGPRAEPVDTCRVFRACCDVLASTAVTSDGRTGIPLTLDAVTGERTGKRAVAIMGFVGANTDAAYVLLRAACDEPKGADRFRTIGGAIINSFVELGLSPPAGEGFDLDTGECVTYKSRYGRRAVFARSVAEGCAAVLDAWRLEQQRGVRHTAWLDWAIAGGDWIVRSQHREGGVPRAWEPYTGNVLDASPSASYVVVPFLLALADVTSEARFGDAALRAGDFAWRYSSRHGCFAGATLDHPNLVDKEAAVLSLEANLALHSVTGDAEWLERAKVAADVAETWIYAWNVPMPNGARDSALHWKQGVPTVGNQLIRIGASMTDGFLAVNAAAFLRLGELTGDTHYIDVARLVTHGTKAMLALPGRTFDLHDVGWQQEHWCFAGRRGYGLNRDWLPWVSVAHSRGILRLRDLASDEARAVLAGDP